MGNTQQASSSSSVYEGEALAGVLQGPAAIVTPSPDPSPVPLDAAGGLGAPVVPAASVALSPPQLPIMDQQAVILPHTVQPEVAGPSGGCRRSSSGSARGSARENRGEASGSGRRRRGRKGHESRYHSHRCRSRSSRWRSPSSSEYSSDSSMSPDRRSHRRGSRRGISRSSRRSTCGATRSHDVPIAVTPLDPTGPAAPHVIPVPAPAVGIPRVVSGCGIGGPAMPLFPLGGGEQRLMPLVSSSVTPATWSGHGKAWGEWLELVGGRDVAGDDEWRFTVTVDYLLRMRELGRSAIVARRRLSGLSFHFKLRGWVDVTKRFSILQALKGWDRTPRVSDARRPVSFSLLLSLMAALQGVCRSPYESLLFQVAFSLAFFGALRVGELVPSSAGGVGGLLQDDVMLTESSVQVKVRKSKTDMLGRGNG
ncbi:uncharacterized protein LOC130356619 isoform X1 [Hyla sarda]|uniref:uncharacterized protein LOC130356619 isoform X1 n=1 Tax=Hyla sarda TaxID=327740 RepID=UPI0024C41207|nr:uncharacterized protein LOC130356619 isoform X1 [Hyla sarda]